MTNLVDFNNFYWTDANTHFKQRKTDITFKTLVRKNSSHIFSFDIGLNMKKTIHYWDQQFIELVMMVN